MWVSQSHNIPYGEYTGGAGCGLSGLVHALFYLVRINYLFKSAFGQANIDFEFIDLQIYLEIFTI